MEKKINVNGEWIPADWEIIRRHLDEMQGVRYETSGVYNNLVHVEVTATPTQVMDINRYIDENI